MQGMTTLSCFNLQVSEHIAHLILNQPDTLNPLHPRFWRELDTVLADLHRRSDVRVLVISSTGKHFSAGMALDTFANPAVQLDDQTPAGRAAVYDTVSELQATFTRLETLRVPVIAAIQGGCIGGAVDMVTATCIRYATADAFFCIQEINIGMVADVGTLQRLPKLIPMGLMKELAYTGRRLSAQRALSAGLVNAVFDTPAAMLEAALACAADIASKPPVAIWGTKQAVNYAQDHSTEDSLRQMGWLQGAIWSNAQVHEAVTAAKTRRAAQFAPLAPLTSFLDLGA